MPSVNSPAAHVPAWKRLGLKLKSQPAPEITVDSPLPIESTSTKRKREDTVNEGPAKKTKVPSATPFTPILSRKKSVTFTPETKIDDGDSIKQLFNSWVAEQKSQDPSFELKTSQPAFDTPEPPKVVEQVETTLEEKERKVLRTEKQKLGKDTKKPKTKKPSKVVKPVTNPSRPFLQYLREYHESRETWKFKKNHQSHLLKHIFDLDIIPSDHAHLIWPYVRGLQGGVRTRLRDAAFAIKVKDQEEGAAGFPEDMVDSDKRQREYEAAMNEYVATMTAANATTKMGYEEGVLLNLSDTAMATRAAKRTRAEQILAELKDSGEVTGKELVNGDTDSQKRLRMNDGSSQKVARKRKQRTVTVEDSSSSSDSSGSEEDSSDESGAENGNENDTSSSSSSSSSGSESGSEEDGSEESDESSEDSSDDEE